MKINDEDFAKLEQGIKPLDTSERREQYRLAGLSDKRYRWDLTYLARLSTVICDMYDYLDDTHIDTALRKIVKPL